jgi:uncharacterized protein YbcC (UPF0753/DUF2309 family)
MNPHADPLFPSPAAAVDAPVPELSALRDCVAQACARIAPTWPLDRFIAVNPYWGWVQRPIEDAAASLGVLARTRLTMPRAWFRERWEGGLLRMADLHEAIDEAGDGRDPVALLDALFAATPAPAVLPLVSDLRDAAPEPGVVMRWTEIMVHQTSQHCAAFFDQAQARWRPAAEDGLFGSWRRQLAADRGLPWRGGRAAAARRLDALPADPLAAIGAVLDALGLPPAARPVYLTALLASVGGWAAWCAHERWQARLAGRDDDAIVALLAIRAAWELLLRDDLAPGGVDAGWAAAWRGADAAVARTLAAQRDDWLLQRAAEIAERRPLCEALSARRSAPAAAAPAVQAVFCIDVRSEVFRRALEHEPGVATRGFAGFFGLPIAYSPLGTEMTRPQLPGLLAPTACATETAPSEDAGRPLASLLARRRRAALQAMQRRAELRGSATSGFSFVEAFGLAYAAKLLADGTSSADAPAAVEHAGLPARAALRPRLAVVDEDPAAAAGLAHGILKAMGLVDGFAPILLLVGHGSRSVNNPHAAGLDCGACGGQTGEVNARVLADLLNAPAVRSELAALGVVLPVGTHVLPALHDTTTDDVTLFDTDAVPQPLQAALAALRTRLAQAGARARSERAAALGLAAIAADPDALADAVRRRGTDWAQVRPEWGLAGCTAFVVAPRARTLGLDLGGRSFLHDYDWRADADGSVLELIMTAPMVVTNWINLQYHASTVDPTRYGSGNKVLHNVVGGRIGVFEGNGGDLRIGLPMQSLHDGTRWMHTPLRLAVFIEAPRAAIDAVIGRHAVVRDLVCNGWLELLRIGSADDGIGWPQTEASGGGVERRDATGWRVVQAAGSAVAIAG